MKCDADAQFNGNLHDCTCPNLHWVAERDPETGVFYDRKKCLPCEEAAFQGPWQDRAVTECQVCPVKGQWYDFINQKIATCVCRKSSTPAYTTAGDTCIEENVVNEYSYSPDSAKSVTYTAIETYSNGSWQTTSISTTSGSIDYYYLKAAVGCKKWKRPKDCQTLANICVLQLYNEGT